VGFMGTGKTSVGRLLAAELGWRFVDLDNDIEERAGLTVAEIFREHGERGFREREHKALRELLSGINDETPTVVALGGGAFVQADNIELLSAAETPSVFLDTPVEELWRRCSAPGEPERPLRTDPAEFNALHARRRRGYLGAKLRVETAGKTVERIAQEVIENLGLQPKGADKETSK
jgi:shikimate kinase